MRRSERHRPDLAMILGVGLDAEDGHTRITTGDNFCLLGGSRETHEHMQEKALQINDKLEQRGKDLRDIHPEEFKEIVCETYETE